MKASVQVLMVEDVETDARLAVAELRRAGYEATMERVQSKSALAEALSRGGWDLLLCDFTLPGLDGLEALRMAKEADEDLPVIVVSGTIGEAAVVEAMRSGARDYVMKDRLSRLGPAVERELREATLRREANRAEANMRDSEHKYRQLFDALSDAVFVIDEASGRVVDTNAAAEQLLGRERAAILGVDQSTLFAAAGGGSAWSLLRDSAEDRRVAGRNMQVRFDREGSKSAHASASWIEIHGRRFLLALVRGGDPGARPVGAEASGMEAMPEREDDVAPKMETGKTRIVEAGAGAAAFLAGALALAGWAADIAEWKSVLPGSVEMKANTALAFVLMGVALVLTGWLGGRRPAARAASRVCSGLAGLIGLVTLLEYVLGWNPGLDQWLVTEPPGATGTSAPGRMAPDSALSFLLLAGALEALGWRRGTRWAPAAAAVAGATVSILALAALQSYATPGLGVFGWWGQTIMAVQTAAVFLTLGAAVTVKAWRSRTVGWVLSDSASLLFLGGLALLVALNMNASRSQARFHELALRDDSAEMERVAHVAYALTSSGTLATVAILVAVLFALNRAERERRRAEIALRRRAAIIDSSEDAVIGETLDGLVTTWNKGAERLLGYTAEEMRGRTLDRLLPEDRKDEERAILARVARGECVEHFETERRAKDGRLLDLSIAVSPILDQAGRVIGASKVARDISAKKRAERALREANESLEQRVAERTAELRRQRDELEAANKELEAFSYTVSHDLRAPLRSIDGFSKIVLTDHTDGLVPEAVEALQLVRSSSQLMGRLIDDLLAFARLGRQALRCSRVETAELVREVIEGLRLEAEGRALEFAEGELPPCFADPDLLRIVWRNLLSNAVKFTRGRAPARIETGARIADDGAAEYFVRDNGVGFKMEHVGKIFGLFQRLNQVEHYEGNGVGLAAARRIVERHGGRMRAEAQPGRGATFFFTLPNNP